MSLWHKRVTIPPAAKQSSDKKQGRFHNLHITALTSSYLKKPRTSFLHRCLEFFKTQRAQQKQNCTIPGIKAVLKSSGFLSATPKLSFKVSERRRGKKSFCRLNCLWCFLNWNGWCTALDMETKAEITESDQSMHLLPIYKQIIFNQLLGNVPRSENENKKEANFPLIRNDVSFASEPFFMLRIKPIRLCSVFLF